MVTIVKLKSNSFYQGEIETQGDFDEVSKSPLFSEQLQEEEEEGDAARPKYLRQRTMSIQVRNL